MQYCIIFLVISILLLIVSETATLEFIDETSSTSSLHGVEVPQTRDSFDGEYDHQDVIPGERVLPDQIKFSSDQHYKFPPGYLSSIGSGDLSQGLMPAGID